MNKLLIVFFLIIILFSCKKNTSPHNEDRITIDTSFPNHFSNLELQMPKVDIVVADSCFYGTPDGSGQNWVDTSIVSVDMINTNLFNRHNYELNLNFDQNKSLNFNLGDIQSSTNYYETYFSNGIISFDTTVSTANFQINEQRYIDKSNSSDFRKFEINSSSSISINNLPYAINDTGLVMIMINSESLYNYVSSIQFKHSSTIRNIFYSEDSLRKLINFIEFEPDKFFMFKLIP